MKTEVKRVTGKNHVQKIKRERVGAHGKLVLDAYLSVMTTGLALPDAEIIVVGLYLARGSHGKMVQLVGKDITTDSLIEALSGVQNILTYNGSRFDLPFIQAALGIDLETIVPNRHDLMYDCWRCNLYGGLQAVEQQLGISRKLQNITVLDARKLWRKYQHKSDREALTMLLKYNQEDVMNLKVLRERIDALTECLTGVKD